jgi:hypothetical protein
MSELFTVEDESNRQYRRFNAVGTQLTVRLASSCEEDGTDAVTHFLNSMTEFLSMHYQIVMILI